MLLHNMNILMCFKYGFGPNPISNVWHDFIFDTIPSVIFSSDSKFNIYDTVIAQYVLLKLLSPFMWFWNVPGKHAGDFEQ